MLFRLELFNSQCYKQFQYLRLQTNKMIASGNTQKIGNKSEESQQIDKVENNKARQQNQAQLNFLNKDKQQIKQLNNVTDAKNKLDNLIEDLNDKLVHHFKMKEEALLNQYKQELVEQQKKLNQLKNTTNQEQIRAKMLQRKAELEKQRNHLIQTNMFFSQKCEQYKQTYSKLVQEAKDLEKQIQFLDNQIQIANAKRLTIVDEMGSISNVSHTERNSDLPMFTNKKINVLPELDLTSEKNQNTTLQKTHNTHSVRKIARSLHVQNKEKPKKSSSTKNFQKIDKAIFNKSTLQKVFQDCVEEVKNRRKSKRTMPNLKGEQFTEYEKRAIMQIFLTNEQVKKKLYEIIFGEGNQKNFKRGLPKQIQKAKITFDELGP